MSSPHQGQSQESESEGTPIYVPSSDIWEDDDDDMDFEGDDTEYATGDDLFIGGSEDLEETEYYGRSHLRN